MVQSSDGLYTTVARWLHKYNCATPSKRNVIVPTPYGLVITRRSREHDAHTAADPALNTIVSALLRAQIKIVHTNTTPSTDSSKWFSISYNTASLAICLTMSLACPVHSDTLHDRIQEPAPVQNSPTDKSSKSVLRHPAASRDADGS